MKSASADQLVSPSPASPLRVLLLEHSSHDAASILRELRDAGISVQPTILDQRSDFEAALSSQGFAAILAAYSLPGWTGLDALSYLRQTGNDIPFLLVTGMLSERAAVECIQQGVADYILKDRLARLPIALKHALEAKQLRDMNAQFRFQLEESEARSRELIENSIYGIFRVTLEGSFLSANAALFQILACNSLHELQSLNLASDVFRYPENYSRLLASCREHGLVHSDETEWRRRDGGLVSVRLHFRYLSLPGPADAIEGVAEDVTELRLLERQLLQAQKFESIGQLAGGIAHDFNNVIGAILGWAELGFEQSRSHPVIAERFAHIREQADRAASLTRELLAFARRQTLQPRPVDLNTAFHSLASFFDKVIDKNIEMKFIPANLQPVKADPAQIEQVLMNLCLNARDAMPDGGRLTIETEMAVLDDSFRRLYPYVIPGPYAVLSVSDTGVGMDPETRERIFEPFFTTKERGKGSGMGLATVYGIVKQHGGFIHVYSEPQQGSLFRVYLPAMEVSLSARGSSPEPSPTLNLHGSETILIAEDHDSIREMVRQTLVGLGYRVLAASDGEQALRLCETDTPALAILDVIMPRLGGPATASALLTSLPSLPVLFTSGYSESAGSCHVQVPSSRYLQKPYSPTALGRAVREILDAALPCVSV